MLKLWTTSAPLAATARPEEADNTNGGHFDGAAELDRIYAAESVDDDNINCENYKNGSNDDIDRGDDDGDKTAADPLHSGDPSALRTRELSIVTEAPTETEVATAVAVLAEIDPSLTRAAKGPKGTGGEDISFGLGSLLSLLISGGCGAEVADEEGRDDTPYRTADPPRRTPPDPSAPRALADDDDDAERSPPCSAPIVFREGIETSSTDRGELYGPSTECRLGLRVFDDKERAKIDEEIKKTREEAVTPSRAVEEEDTLTKVIKRYKAWGQGKANPSKTEATPNKVADNGETVPENDDVSMQTEMTGKERATSEERGRKEVPSITDTVSTHTEKMKEKKPADIVESTQTEKAGETKPADALTSKKAEDGVREKKEWVSSLSFRRIRTPQKPQQKAATFAKSERNGKTEQLAEEKRGDEPPIEIKKAAFNPATEAKPKANTAVTTDEEEADAKPTRTEKPATMTNNKVSGNDEPPASISSTNILSGKPPKSPGKLGNGGIGEVSSKIPPKAEPIIKSFSFSKTIGGIMSSGKKPPKSPKKISNGCIIEGLSSSEDKDKILPKTKSIKKSPSFGKSISNILSSKPTKPPEKSSVEGLGGPSGATQPAALPGPSASDDAERLPPCCAPTVECREGFEILPAECRKCRERFETIGDDDHGNWEGFGASRPTDRGESRGPSAGPSAERREGFEPFVLEDPPEGSRSAAAEVAEGEEEKKIEGVTGKAGEEAVAPCRAAEDEDALSRVIKRYKAWGQGRVAMSKAGATSSNAGASSSNAEVSCSKVEEEGETPDEANKKSEELRPKATNLSQAEKAEQEKAAGKEQGMKQSSAANAAFVQMENSEGKKPVVDADLISAQARKAGEEKRADDPLEKKADGGGEIKRRTSTLTFRRIRTPQKPRPEAATAVAKPEKTESINPEWLATKAKGEVAGKEPRASESGSSSSAKPSKLPGKSSSEAAREGSSSGIEGMILPKAGPVKKSSSFGKSINDILSSRPPKSQGIPTREDGGSSSSEDEGMIIPKAGTIARSPSFGKSIGGILSGKPPKSPGKSSNSGVEGVGSSDDGDKTPPKAGPIKKSPSFGKSINNILSSRPPMSPKKSSSGGVGRASSSEDVDETLPKAEPTKKSPSFGKSINNILSSNPLMSPKESSNGGVGRASGSEDEDEKLPPAEPTERSHSLDNTIGVIATSGGKNANAKGQASSSEELQGVRPIENSPSARRSTGQLEPIEESRSFRRSIGSFDGNREKINEKASKEGEPDSPPENARAASAAFDHFQVVIANSATDMMVRLPARRDHTFDDLRREIEDDDLLPFEKFRFMAKAGGTGLCKEQEKKRGAREYGPTDRGDGSCGRPYRVYVEEEREVRLAACGGDDGDEPGE